eukprot:8054158-Pyramimonas_sp.AAC.1
MVCKRLSDAPRLVRGQVAQAGAGRRVASGAAPFFSALVLVLVLAILLLVLLLPLLRIAARIPRRALYAA